MSNGVCKFWAVFAALIIATAVFTFFYGKKYQSELDEEAFRKRDAENTELIARIAARDKENAAHKLHIASLQDSIKNRKPIYAYIDKKADAEINRVIQLNTDSAVSYFANWLSQEDSTKWRYVNSND